jgi:hypothetical protein
MHHGLHAGEINIEGGEQNIIDDDNEDEEAQLQDEFEGQDGEDED